MKVSVYDNLQVKCEGQKIVFSLLKMQTYFRHGFLHLKTLILRLDLWLLAFVLSHAVVGTAVALGECTILC